MGELWRDLSDLLWKRPVLWLPVLAADLLGFLVNLGRSAWLRAIVLRGSEYHSALGGAPTHAAMTPGTVETTSILALLITWASYFLRLLFYAAALIITSALARGFLSRLPNPWTEIGPRLRATRGGIVELTLRSLAVYAVAALVLGLLGKTVAKAGGAAILRSGWFDPVLTLLVIAVLAITVAPAAVHILAGRAVTPAIDREAQVLAFSTGIVSMLLGTFVAMNVRTLLHTPPSIGIPLEIVGSLLVALPFAPMFVGLILLARKAVREADIVAEESAV